MVLFLCRLSTPIYCRIDDQYGSFYVLFFGLWKHSVAEQKLNIGNQYLFVQVSFLWFWRVQIAEEGSTEKTLVIRIVHIPQKSPALFFFGAGPLLPACFPRENPPARRRVSPHRPSPRGRRWPAAKEDNIHHR